jgi:8-oxo-dGTP pyrophosphatase MutT (NUDIX family)
MTRPPIQTFQVGVKAFVWHERRLLVVQERGGAQLWELPGGRIDAGEELTPLPEVLRRELREELGAGFGCTIGEPVACWVRASAPGRSMPVFLAGLRCIAPSGAIELSDEHVAWRWIGAGDVDALRFAPGYAAPVTAFFARESSAS